MEACGFEPSNGHFAYMFKQKAIVNHMAFGCITSHGDAARIGALPSNVGQWKNDFFFYLSARLEELKIDRKWQIVHKFSFIWFYLTFLTFFLFADPQPRPALEDTEVSHVRIFNTLSKG